MPIVIESTSLHLPESISLIQYAEDFLVIAGPGLTREQYQTIKAVLPEEIRERVHGFRKTWR